MTRDLFKYNTHYSEFQFQFSSYVTVVCDFKVYVDLLITMDSQPEIFNLEDFTSSSPETDPNVEVFILIEYLLTDC